MKKQVPNVIEYLRERRWIGEAGVGFLVAVLVGFPIQITAPAASVWEVPLSLVWGAGAGLGAFLISASLQLIQKR